MKRYMLLLFFVFGAGVLTAETGRQQVIREYLAAKQKSQPKFGDLFDDPFKDIPAEWKNRLQKESTGILQRRAQFLQWKIMQAKKEEQGRLSLALAYVNYLLENRSSPYTDYLY